MTPSHKRLLEIGGIHRLWNGVCLFWWRRALKEIDPLHHDVPRIVRRINELEHA